MWRRALVRRAQYVPRQNRSPRTITPRSVCIAYLALTMCRVRARTHDWRVPANPASTDRDTLELLRPFCPSYKHHVRLRTRESDANQPSSPAIAMSSVKLSPAIKRQLAARNPNSFTGPSRAPLTSVLQRTRADAQKRGAEDGWLVLAVRTRPKWDYSI